MRDLDEDARPLRGAVRQAYDLTEAAALEYSPDLDGLADPGEIVWAWVPYEEDAGRGKDRPLLVVGRHGRRLLGMMLSSREPDPAYLDDWLELGSGVWDREARPSYLRLDRVFELDEDDIRREGAVLDGARFARTAAVLHRRLGWPFA
ncbi:type II toxin-antitoxin system PemK/MazF family toxin [Allonocardiopsis opalescens]|uniref:PemK-like, MazF-like toxin of type II toxin-antitoxin system n=1 Tax=Allonocardiopsis opalescens TaxID=1144618 RepID=A0A2T0QET1_9ACTN|nr:type II toxin-antitoxin system PemK/MazF family toxin [Allonocardiopsis opalescens]PRY02446.1 PemK-like, MazF-like toxin of type II toxin-antitoxin system [Allonocardiopsis opalescens]